MLTEFISKYWMQIFFVIVMSIGGWGFRKISASIQRLTKALAAIKRGVEEILKSKITYYYYYYDEKKEISLDGLQGLLGCYNAYKDLQPDCEDIDKLVKDIKELKVVDTGRKRPSIEEVD